MSSQEVVISYYDVFSGSSVKGANWESWNLKNVFPSPNVLEAANRVASEECSAYDILTTAYIISINEGLGAKEAYFNEVFGEGWDKKVGVNSIGKQANIHEDDANMMYVSGADNDC